MNTKNSESPLVNVAREEFQVSKDFPLIITLDTPVGKGTVVGMMIGFAGVYIVSFGFEIVKFNSIKGPVFMLLSSILFGAYIVL